MSIRCGQAVAVVHERSRMLPVEIGWLRMSLLRRSGVRCPTWSMLDVVRDRCCRRVLPSYMVPDSADSGARGVPVSIVNGKIDRKLLPEPVFEKAVFRAPVTAVEEIVASVFAEAAGCGSCGSR